MKKAERQDAPLAADESHAAEGETPEVQVGGAKDAKKPAVGRRAFVGFVAAIAASCAVGGASVAFAGENDLLRPPGGQDENLMLAACLRCDRCRSICPQNCVSVAAVDDGFLRARTPKINFHKGYCDFCNKCIDVCPTGALVAFDHEIDKVGVAIVQRDRCLAYAQGCNNCKESCEYGALVFDKSGHPVVDAALCNGCGRCEYDCTALVYGSFSGGTRRGIRVTPYAEYEKVGSTLVEGSDN